MIDKKISVSISFGVTLGREYSMSIKAPFETTRNFEKVQNFIAENYELETNLSYKQIAYLCVNWIAEMIESGISSEISVLERYLDDASAIGLDEADAQVMYGKMIPLNEWALKNGFASGSGTARNYAVKGRIVGAQKLGRNWLVPENAPLLNES